MHAVAVDCPHSTLNGTLTCSSHSNTAQESRCVIVEDTQTALAACVSFLVAQDGVRETYRVFDCMVENKTLTGVAPPCLTSSTFHLL